MILSEPPTNPYQASTRTDTGPITLREFRTGALRLMKSHRSSTKTRHSLTSTHALLPATIIAFAGIAHAEPQHPAILQWFEASWPTIEYRMPDFFVAGYGGTWLPSPAKTSDANSPGYDPLDRFDLGFPGGETVYGTEQDFRALVDQFKRASGRIYLEAVLNHNSGRTESFGFFEAGGWPGFWAGPVEQKGPLSNWGDFHGGNASGYLQSENPGGPNYDLFVGDLVALVDIAQESNNWMIRHPVDPNIPEGVQSSPFDPPRNIPAGTFRNQPDPDNRRFYPDLGLTPKTINNPGFFRPNLGLGSFNTTAESTTVYPFNTTDPMQGDPIPENAAALLTRWTQWMLDEFGVDGFRMDAIKHVPPWFWDRFWDVYVHDRWVRPDGTTATPFTFGEAVQGNNEILNYWVRKDGFANRDALDLAGAGNIRNIVNGKGLSAISGLDDAHLDGVDDGFNNGSMGVNHIYSHDNGSRGDGGSAPDFPFEDKVAPWAHAYLILRPGPPKIYHNAREFHLVRTGGFWPREGVPVALGYGSYFTLPGSVLETVEDNRIPTLVQLRNRYGRGFYLPRWQDNDTFVFERDGNMLIAITDSYGSSFHTRTVSTNFPAGTRLHEVTGNATNPDVDPGNNIFDVVTVGAGGTVTIRIPYNGPASNEHNSGYVVYAPITPAGTLTITNQHSVIPADPPTAPSLAYQRRLTPIAVIKAATFNIDLDTTQADPLDPNTDDSAIFRINAGFQDLNNNGTPGDLTGEFDSYENFLTTNSPLFTGGSGSYIQTINTDDLPEGNNYISVIAFRHRASGDPIYSEWRQVIYVDRQAPDLVIDPQIDCFTGDGNIFVTNPDRTATSLSASINGGPNINGLAWDRNVWIIPVSNLTAGNYSIDITVTEAPGGTFVGSYVVPLSFDVDNLTGDIDRNGIVDARDLHAFELLTDYDCVADLNADQQIDEADRRLLRELVGDSEDTDMLTNR